MLDVTVPLLDSELVVNLKINSNKIRIIHANSPPIHQNLKQLCCLMRSGFDSAGQFSNC